MGSMKDLFGDTPYPEQPGHVRASDTSHAAARSMDDAAPSLRQKVYDLIAANPKGLTADHIEHVMDGRHQTISARVRELALMGKIKGNYILYSLGILGYVWSLKRGVNHE